MWQDAHWTMRWTSPYWARLDCYHFWPYCIVLTFFIVFHNWFWCKKNFAERAFFSTQNLLIITSRSLFQYIYFLKKTKVINSKKKLILNLKPVIPIAWKGLTSKATANAKQNKDDQKRLNKQLMGMMGDLYQSGDANMKGMVEDAFQTAMKNQKWYL